MGGDRNRKVQDERHPKERCANRLFMGIILERFFEQNQWANERENSIF